MSKTTRSSNKVKWSEMDKRVRARRAVWSANERQELETELGKLADQAENADVIEVVQPALSRKQPEGEVASTEQGLDQPAAERTGG